MTNADTAFRALGETAMLGDLAIAAYYVEGLKRRVAVARVDATLYAFDDLCPRDRCPLSAGRLEGTTIMCQCAGCQFDITTGEVLRGPADAPLRTYVVRDQEGQLQARVE